VPEPADGSPTNTACPRCGEAFRCGVADVAPCACTTLALDAALRAELRARYVGCLCLRCLHELAGARQAPARAASR
jgi:hypothetical protein